MTNREQAIKRMAEAAGNTETYIKGISKYWVVAYALDTTEKLLAAEARVLELEAALKEILENGEIDAALQHCDEYPQSMKRARLALQPKGE